MLFLFLGIAFAGDERCNEYFCYLQKAGTKELELIGIEPNFFFSWYGMMNSKPLDLDPKFGDGSYLTSINFNFPPSYYSMKMIIPSTVKYFKPGAFHNVQRVSINLTIGEDTIIEDSAFAGCSNLLSITFIGKAKKIGDNAFAECTGLLSISEINAEQIGNGAFSKCTNLNCELKIGTMTKIIGDEAFINCFQLKGDLIIPNSVSYIGKSAFEKCSSLNGTLTIPDSLSSIGSRAFYECSKLKGEVKLPNNFKIINNEVFYGCQNLQKLEIPETVESIGSNAFFGCTNLKGDLVIPASVDVIRTNAFFGCTSFDDTLAIQSAATVIQEGAFNQTRFTRFIYPGKIEQKVLDSIGLPNGITVVTPQNLKVHKISFYKIDEEPEANKLSIASIVAIIVSVFATLAIIIIAIFFIVQKIQSKKNYQEI